VAALTETVRAYEGGLVALRDGLRRVAIQRQSIEAELAARSGEISQLLGVLQSMGQAPAPLLMLHPSGPLGTARSGMMLADVTPALQQEVARLQADLATVRDLTALQDGAAQTLQDGLAGAQQARLALTTAIFERTDLPRRFAEDPARTAQLLASSQTLEGFANGLTGIVDHQLSSTAPDARALKGTLTLPVQGRILRRFAEPDAAGIVRPGWVIATRPGALVQTPVAATIRFQGPLLDYGNVIILEPAADVLFVIAGLGTVFGETGQILPAGSPIGLVGG
jgi:septal ring factor EnvC (AmiA/AmiB activator)